MIIVMIKGTSRAECDAVCQEVAKKGLEPNLSIGSEVTLIGCKGVPKADREILSAYFHRLAGVERVIAIIKPYQLAALETCPERTKVVLDGIAIGGPRIVIMAGPCAIENEEHVRQTAQLLSELKIPILRGGAFKPRTSPRSFQGLGERALQILRACGEKYNLYTVSEAMKNEQIGLVAGHCTIVQIGARNMQNYELLTEAGKLNQPVLLKRGFAATLEELLSAAEYILQAGNGQVILCERGIRTFNDGKNGQMRFTPDIGAIPLLKTMTHLPVIFDPSHAAGDDRFVTPLTLSAIAAGADGLLVEIDPCPQERLCDANQLLDFNQFRALVSQVRLVAKAIGRDL